MLQTSLFQRFKQLWKDFYSLYKEICIEDVATELPKTTHSRAKEWINFFTILGAKQFGYTTAIVIPYIYLLAYHVPFYSKLWLPDTILRTRRRRKRNYDTKCIYYQKSNNGMLLGIFCFYSHDIKLQRTMNGLNESLRKRHGVVEWKNNELLGKKGKVPEGE